MATLDALTGLPNRYLLDEQLTLRMAEAGRFDPQLALLFIDLDNFKNINDSFGHEAGDKLLKIVAERWPDACAATTCCRVSAATSSSSFFQHAGCQTGRTCRTQRCSMHCSPGIEVEDGNSSFRQHRHQHLPRRRESPATCYAQPTPRCIPRKKPAATVTALHHHDERGPGQAPAGSSRDCARHLPTVICISSISRRSRLPAAASAAARHCCAGAVRQADPAG